MNHERAGLEQFLKDILPFFHRRRLTYVDVGAYDARVFEKVLASGLDVGEAHLFEPNPVSLDAARARVGDSFKGHFIDYHPLAVGARLGRVRMHAAKTLTRVIADAPHTANDDTLFEVDCTTLDTVADRFTDRRISLLKIDVEGYEADVLNGAQALLKDHRIDCLYVEAGLNPDASQQCYHRRIDDILLAHGYAPFRIYEQHHEWIEDSPLLRRMNVAYLSRSFAGAHPYRLTRELFDAHRRLEQRDAELVAVRQAAEAAAADAEARRVQAERQQRRLETVEAERDRHGAESARRADENRRLVADHAQLQSQMDVVTTRLEALAARDAEAADERSELMARLREFHQRELDALKLAGKAQGRLVALRSKPAFRAAKAIRSNLGSFAGWLRMPAAVWREFAVARTQAHGGNSAASPDSPLVFDAGMASLSLLLTVRPQRVQLGVGDETRTLVARALLGGGNRSVTVRITVSASTSAQRILRIGGQAWNGAGDLDSSAVRGKVQVLAGATTPLLELAGPDPCIEIALARERGDFCLLTLEWTQAGAPRPAAPAAPGQGFSVGQLEKKLWGGYASLAIAALERLCDDRFAPASERENAAWQLARWWYAADEPARAFDCLRAAARTRGKVANRVLLGRAQCLVALGRCAEAEELVRRGSDGSRAFDFRLLNSALVHRMALASGQTVAQADRLRLAALNEVLAGGHLAPLALRDATLPLSLDNLTTSPPPPQRSQGPKVSVVMAAFNTAGSIGPALRGLLEQTWRNLEVIVVDDASTDDTTAEVQRFAARDPRVRLLRNAANLGAYRSRNVGARAAGGELLTVHDSDDWSHPQKLERQVDALLAQPGAVAVVSQWVRVDEHLGALGPWTLKGSMVDVNFSSLLFRRSVIEAIGPWDEVRVSGDAEFYHRILAVYGEHAIHKLPRTQLLSFARVRADSLTRSKETHVSSLTYGLRWNYLDAFRHWHATLQHDDSQLPLDPAAPLRRFPVPVGNGPRRQARYRYDLVVIGDFAMRGGAFVSTLNYVVAAARSGLKVAIFHWRKYDLTNAAALRARLYEACVEHGVDILSAGDHVDAESVLFGYPVILAHQIEPMPSIAAQRVLVIVNQFASRLADGGDPQYDPLELRRRLVSLFGMEGVWIPISAWVSRLMKADARYPAPYPKPWSPMLDAEAWCGDALRWRGEARRAPVVGRHGRDAYTKWPSSAENLRLAYGVGQPWDVRFLGGADHAIGVLGERPANWAITPFDGVPAQDFLRELDFFVHYPHEMYIEEFGRAVMEAMAVGVPCILPPQFAETFGDAASYAQPADVAATVAALWSSKDAYLERAAAGRRFVLDQCDSRGFARRFAELVATTAAPATQAAPAPHPDLNLVPSAEGRC